ncbi:hypothetical protein Pen02_83060 [Plantactinospora endophytica]|uniref:Uncharacterized protein n=1 Tax=Plantactinospora endophytica TaxID=673535 RepID=A0ABQ4EF65_9ACTN|nr:hypothetical protein Pen02_83060 [Plantactinospora endophytica]
MSETVQHREGLRIGPHQVVVLVVPVQGSYDQRREVHRPISMLSGAAPREPGESGQRGEPRRTATLSHYNKPVLQFSPYADSIRLTSEPAEQHPDADARITPHIPRRAPIEHRNDLTPPSPQKHTAP